MRSPVPDHRLVLPKPVLEAVDLDVDASLKNFEGEAELANLDLHVHRVSFEK